MDPPIAFVEFADGITRPVYVAPDGRQYVVDPYGHLVFGVWFIPRDEDAVDVPIVIRSS